MRLLPSATTNPLHQKAVKTGHPRAGRTITVNAACVCAQHEPGWRLPEFLHTGRWRLLRTVRKRHPLQAVATIRAARSGRVRCEAKRVIPEAEGRVNPKRVETALFGR
jgi:hypothetical protein